MFTKQMSASERLAAWRSIRHQFANEQSAVPVVKEFSKIKPEQRYLDYYTPSSWPSVFEIVTDGFFCQSGITLVLTATLVNLEFIKSNEVTLDVISNHITGREGLVLRYNDEYYNFIAGEISAAAFVAENSTLFERHVVSITDLLK